MMTPTPERLRALWDACAAWRDENKPLSAESIYQVDSVMLSAPDLVIAVCDVVGYAATDEEPAGCSRCNGGGLLQNPEDGWRPGLVLTREAEACVRAVFCGQSPPVCETKWQPCPTCGGQ